MFVIAGATGHVGSVAADRLLGAGKPVRVIVRDEAKGAAWSARGAEVAVGDLSDAAFVAGALRGAVGFFALIPPDYAAPDVFAGQRRVADAIAGGVLASGAPHVVMLSSVGADLPTGTGPIKGLHYFEERLRESGTILTALRASYFQENAAAAIVPARNAGIFPNFGDRDDVPFPMVATKDVGEEAARCLLNPPRQSEVIDVVGPACSMKDVASALGAAMGMRLQVVNLPRSQWVATFLQAGISQSGAESLAEMYDGAGKGLLQPRGDRQVQATTAIEETMRAMVAAS